MIDRIETQQEDQQYTEKKEYKAINSVFAFPSTNRTFIAWVNFIKSTPNQVSHIIMRTPLTPVEMCGYHVIHNEGKPTERHEWLLKEHFDNAYRPAENHGNSDDYQQGKPTDDELLNAYSRYVSHVERSIAVSGKSGLPMTYDEFVESKAARSWIFKPYNRKELDEKFKEKDLSVYKRNTGDGATATKAFDWAEWEEYKDDLHHFSPEYKAYVKEQISIFGEIMSPDLFNAGAMLTEKLAGSQSDNMKCGVTGSVSASKCDAVTYDIKESLKAQFDKIKGTGDKTQLKQEIDRAQAMISLAQAINSFK